MEVKSLKCNAETVQKEKKEVEELECNAVELENHLSTMSTSHQCCINELQEDLNVERKKFRSEAKETGVLQKELQTCKDIVEEKKSKE